MTKLLAFLGRTVLQFLTQLGGVVILGIDALRSIGAAGRRSRLVLEQMLEVGMRSQAVVLVTGAFTGAVFAAQTFFQFKKVSMESAVGAVVSVAMCRELGPVLAGLMVAGRVGASMSAEIGTMKVTEQIDALRALGVYPIDYLVVPRTVALMIAMPLLVAESIACGMFAGYFVATNLLGIDGAPYWINMQKFTVWSDVFMGTTKGFFFGLIIVFVSCYRGLNASEGAVGVGRATTEAVVVSSLSILVANFFLTMALNIFFPVGG